MIVSRGRGAGIRTLNEGFGDPSDNHFTTPLDWYCRKRLYMIGFFWKEIGSSLPVGFFAA
jgi:hypothetical protein